jgi:hypothetical protein
MIMPLNAVADAEYRLQHRHADGDYFEMQEVPRHHDPAEHDAERWWDRVRVFKCTRCEETVIIGPEEDAPIGPPPL